MILSVCPNPSVDILAEIDQIKPSMVNRLKKEIHFPGGKGVHVALAISEMKVESELLAFWGGPTGNWIQEKCQENGIKPGGVEVSGWNRNCYTFKSANPEYNDTEILGVGPVITKDEELAFYSKFNKAVKNFDIITMSGSWPKGASKEGYRQLIERSRDAKVFLDCTGEQLRNALETRPYCIHVNASEAYELFQKDHPAQNTEVLLDYCQIAAVTAGKEGLYIAFGSSNILHANVEINECKSAVGSGDCLLAGLAVATWNNYSPQDVAKLGVACGAANCLRDDLGMIYKNDVDRLFKKVKVRQFIIN